MKPAQFQYHAPTSIEEAVEVLGEYGDEAKVLAGGQSLVPMLAMRLTRFDHLVDLNRVAELQYLRVDDSSLTVGSMTRQAAAERSPDVTRLSPLLSRALPHIGHFQIRNRGTIGGSIAHGDPASELPAVTCALDADVEVRGRNGSRTIAATEFFLSTWETAVSPDEMVVSVRFPSWDGRSGFALEEFALRRGDFAISGVACGVTVDASSRLVRAAIAFMGMGTTPIRASGAERAVLGLSTSEIDVVELAHLAVAATNPTDDIHASAAYRRSIGDLLVRRAFGRALEEAIGE